MKPTIKTVFGDIAPSTLGRTLTHEHLSMRFDVSHVPLPDQLRHLGRLPWHVENLGWIRQYPYSHDDNIVFNDQAAEEAIIDSVKMFKENGGGAIVENSTVGLHRKTKFLKNVSEKTGVHVIAGTGYYVAPSYNRENLSVEKMSGLMTSELLTGCEDDPSVKAGFIGEIGCCYPMHENERKAIQASAETQEQIGCAVSFHPGRDPKSPFEIMRIFLEAGGKMNKTIMSHLERTLQDPGSLLEFSNFGVYCQFDLFGIENSYYQLNPLIDFPNDAQRIQLICHLIKAGKEDRILVAHDMHTKHRLEKYGGHGFKHLLTVAAPKMLAKGVTQDQLDKIFIHNPAEVLAYY